MAGLSDGGVYLNVGSAVILPEVFLKAFTIAQNLGSDLKQFVTVNLDMQQHYRPLHNVVGRPAELAAGATPSPVTTSCWCRCWLRRCWRRWPRRRTEKIPPPPPLAKGEGRLPIRRKIWTLKKTGRLGLDLPPIPTPVANYVPAVRVGSLVFLSGHGPGLLKDGQVQFIQGKVGGELTVEQGYEAAKQVMLNLLQTLKQELGDLDRVKRVVKLLGFVNCAEDFQQQPQVINGASDLRRAVRRARSARPFGGRHVPAAVQHRGRD